MRGRVLAKPGDLGIMEMRGARPGTRKAPVSRASISSEVSVSVQDTSLEVEEVDEILSQISANALFDNSENEASELSRSSSVVAELAGSPGN